MVGGLRAQWSGLQAVKAVGERVLPPCEAQRGWLSGLAARDNEGPMGSNGGRTVCGAWPAPAWEGAEVEGRLSHCRLVNT